MGEKKPEDPEEAKRRKKLFRHLDEREAIAREHGGAPAFRVLEDTEDVFASVVRVTQLGDAEHVLAIDITGADDIPDVRVIVLRKHFESLVEDYLDQ